MVRRGNQAQEEMVGFALIVVIVAVILLFFMVFSLKSSDQNVVRSYEVESFLQSIFHYTTDCEDNQGILSLDKIIFSCQRGDECLDGREACEVLDSTVSGLVEESWDVGENSSVRGYDFVIKIGDSEMFNKTAGDLNGNSKGAMQPFPKDIEIYFSVYY